MKKLFTLFLGITILSSIFFNNTISYAAKKDNKNPVSIEKEKFTNEELLDIISESEYQKNDKLKEQGIYQYKKTKKSDNKVGSEVVYTTITIDIITDATNTSDNTSNTKNLLSMRGNNNYAITDTTKAITDENTNSNVSLLGGGSNYAWTNDGSITCMIYTTVYYTTSIGADGFDYITITKVTGGYNMLDSTFGIYSQSLSYGQTGTTYASGKANYSGSYTPTTSSWTTYPTGFQPIQISTSYTTIVGANYTVKIKRNNGTTIVTIPLSNYIYNY
jgi:hypothetical protein